MRKSVSKVRKAEKCIIHLLSFNVPKRMRDMRQLEATGLFLFK